MGFQFSNRQTEERERFGESKTVTNGVREREESDTETYIEEWGDDDEEDQYKKGDDV